MGDKKKVLLGMSGGVDSSVAAILLKEQGYEVIGCTMELCKNSSCCNIETYTEAKKICKALGFEHFIYNLSEDFQKHVIDDFVSEYKICHTPNPCIECNKYLKFGLMWEKAKSLGCDYIATGHYAKSVFDKKYNKYVLKKSENEKKDQSYVLYTIPKDLIRHLLLPLGEYKSKDEVRQKALDYGFGVASKKDSEDICFIPDGNYKAFLEKLNFKAQKGNIILKDGTILGQHKGLYRYTIGQRKGLGISYKEPLFVVAFNALKNELIVGTEKDLYSNEFMVKDVNLLLVDSLDTALKCEVKIRYSAKTVPCTIQKIDNNLVKVVVDSPIKSVTPGQSAVFYVDDIVVRGRKNRLIIEKR